MTPEVLGLGELLWDCFPDRRLPGGAPANVAFHAQQLGLRAATVTRVGADPLGDELCAFLSAQGLCLDYVQRDPVHGTGTVTVEPQGTQTRYTFKPDSAWDFLEPTDSLLEAMRSARAICFGTLAQRNETARATIARCLSVAAPDCQIVYDINLRPPFYQRDWIEASLGRATIAKLNDDEAGLLADMFQRTVSDMEDVAHWLRSEFDLDLVCITRGARGCLLKSAVETVSRPGIAIEVVDTVGAGDAFTAGLIRGRLSGWTLERTAEFANRLGALVASRAGAMPVLGSALHEIGLDVS